MISDVPNKQQFRPPNPHVLNMPAEMELDPDNVSAKSSPSARVVIPGDPVPEIPPSDVVILGPGLRREGPHAIVTRPGVLRHKPLPSSAEKLAPKAIYWVDTHAKRYVAARGEHVIGVILAKAGDTFRVDIGTSEPASLSFMAFEGATKKNRPNALPGDVVYAKLLVASRDMEPELVCVDAYGKKAGMGVLSGGGFVFTTPLHVIRKLLSPDCVLLKTLGDSIPFEIAVGMNGRIWVRCKSVKETISLANAISVAEYMNNDEIKAMSAKLVNALAGF
eukprot:TCALIF_09684-PA protein Name:"Similar to Exosc3 Exosome complex component RRP40 (Mus musculus)" AED:0.07 eAED:0.07 QI:0/-1/0/1/-1/1/1/0/276